MSDKNNKQTDHDLLQRVDQKLDSFTIEVRTALKDLKDGTVSRIESLERDKADRAETEALQKKIDTETAAFQKKIDGNIEVRIRSLETDRVTQREHQTLLDKVTALDNGQTKIYSWASAFAFVVSLIVGIIIKIMK